MNYHYCTIVFLSNRCRIKAVTSLFVEQLSPHAASLISLLLVFPQLSLPRCSELYADWQPGTKEACVPLSDELCQESARHGHHGCQQLCEGSFPKDSVISTSCNPSEVTFAIVCVCTADKQPVFQGTKSCREVNQWAAGFTLWAFYAPAQSTQGHWNHMASLLSVGLGTPILARWIRESQVNLSVYPQG